MKASKMLSLIAIIFLLIFIPLFTETTNAFTCSECESLYYASIDYYSEYEVKETLRKYGCDDCPNMAFLYGSSNNYNNYDYSSNSGAGDACCLVGGIFALLLLIVIIYYLSKPKKSDNKKSLSQNDRYCPNCGRGIPFNAKVCPYCGKQFEVYFKGESDKMEEKKHIESIDNNIINCPTCGLQNKPTGKFCKKCGTKLGE